MTDNHGIYLGQGPQPSYLLLKYANRHGLIAGATGTGKTLTLQGLAEGFSKAGVPVFIADIKGDLAGLSQKGIDKAPLVARAKEINFPLDYQAFPVVFWDIFGEQGHPIRTTVSEMGPLLLSRLLQLNDVQEGVLNVVFAAADAEGLLLLDLDDLRSMLTYVSENAADISAKFGNVTPTSIAAIQRSLLVLDQQGGAKLFGEPALDIGNFMRTSPNGDGMINVLSADRLMTSPRLYAMFMLWLLSELFEELPEVGDLDKPKLVFFFDEAHLLFDGAPNVLIEKIEQLVRLIRSKGVGVFFISQNSTDIPATVLGQLSNRIQHAIRAFTPQDHKGVKAAAETFRANPAFDTAEVMTQLAVGEALVSTLDERGSPTVVERVLIHPPLSLVGTISADQRLGVINQSSFAGIYDVPVNRESAAELLIDRLGQGKSTSSGSLWKGIVTTVAAATAATAGRSLVSSLIRTVTGAKGGRQADNIGAAMAKTAVRSAGGTLGRQIMRGLMGALLK